MAMTGKYKGHAWSLKRKTNTAHRTRGYILSIKGPDGHTVHSRYVSYYAYLGSPSVPRRMSEQIIDDLLEKKS